MAKTEATNANVNATATSAIEDTFKSKLYTGEKDFGSALSAQFKADETYFYEWHKLACSAVYQAMNGRGDAIIALHKGLKAGLKDAFISWLGSAFSYKQKNADGSETTKKLNLLFAAKERKGDVVTELTYRTMTRLAGDATETDKKQAMKRGRGDVQKFITPEMLKAAFDNMGDAFYNHVAVRAAAASREFDPYKVAIGTISGVLKRITKAEEETGHRVNQIIVKALSDARKELEAAQTKKLPAFEGMDKAGSEPIKAQAA
jgi:hypothetical protein